MFNNRKQILQLLSCRRIPSRTRNRWLNKLDGIPTSINTVSVIRREAFVRDTHPITYSINDTETTTIPTNSVDQATTITSNSNVRSNNPTVIDLTASVRFDTVTERLIYPSSKRLHLQQNNWDTPSFYWTTHLQLVRYFEHKYSLDDTQSNHIADKIEKYHQELTEDPNNIDSDSEIYRLNRTNDDSPLSEEETIGREERNTRLSSTVTHHTLLFQELHQYISKNEPNLSPETEESSDQESSNATSSPSESDTTFHPSDYSEETEVLDEDTTEDSILKPYDDYDEDEDEDYTSPDTDNSTSDYDNSTSDSSSEVWWQPNGYPTIAHINYFDCNGEQFEPEPDTSIIFDKVLIRINIRGQPTIHATTTKYNSLDPNNEESTDSGDSSSEHSPTPSVKRAFGIRPPVHDPRALTHPEYALDDPNSDFSIPYKRDRNAKAQRDRDAKREYIDINADLIHQHDQHYNKNNTRVLVPPPSSSSTDTFEPRPTKRQYKKDPNEE
jgi:hypothetical protein